MKIKASSLAIGGCLGAILLTAFDAGKTAYTKNYETDLLTDPQPLAASVATLPLGSSVKIIELQAHWAEVSSGQTNGWVYLGNLAEDKPAEDHSIQGLQVGASQTTASIAARPLDNVATS